MIIQVISDNTSPSTALLIVENLDIVIALCTDCYDRASTLQNIIPSHKENLHRSISLGQKKQPL